MFWVLLPLVAFSFHSESYERAEPEDPDTFFDGVVSPSPVGPGLRAFPVNDFSSGFSSVNMGNNADIARTIMLQTDGQIVIGGVSTGGDKDIGIARIYPDGSLDTSFHTDGKLTMDVGSDDDVLHALALQTDGKVVAAGRGNFGNIDFLVMRFLPSGTMDTSFHTDGIATTEVADNTDIARAVSVLPSGDILVAGYTWLFGAYHFAATRYATDGNLDTSFNTGRGRVVKMISSSDSGALSLSVQSDSKFILGGPADISSNWDFAFARFLSSGEIDTSFSTDGIHTQPVISGEDRLLSLALQENGGIIGSGKAYNGSDFDFALVRLDASGALDTSFHTDGLLSHSMIANTPDVAFRALALAGGGILSAGYTEDTPNLFAIARYTSSGVFDTSFNTDGKTTSSIGTGENSAYTAMDLGGGAFLVAGTSHNGSDNDFALARYQSTGATAEAGGVDVGFATQGSNLINFSGLDEANAIVVTTNGKFVLAGNDATKDFVAARLTSDGTIDTSFNTTGGTTIDISGDDIGRSAVLFADGGFVIGGNDATADMVLVKLLTNGTLDTAFHTDGKAIHDIAGNEQLRAMVLQTDGQLLAVGCAVGGGNDFALVRVNSDGSLDTSFSTDGKAALVPIGTDDVGLAVAVATNGQIVTSGTSYNVDNYEASFVRYTSDGTLDTSFHTDGTHMFDVSGSDLVDYAFSIAIDPNGSIAWVGDTNNKQTIGRLMSDGVFDTSFYTDGINYLTGMPGGRFRSLLQLPNKKLIAGGYDSANFVIMRFLTDGNLDSSFSTDGIQANHLGGLDYGYALTLTPDQRICIAGTGGAGSDIAVACYFQ